MKKNLGKRIFLFLLPFVLEASVVCQQKISRDHVVVGEPVVLNVACDYKAPQGYTYWLGFKTVDNEKYQLQLFDSHKTMEDEHEGETFRFTLFAKQQGHVDVALEATLQIVEKKALDYATTGRNRGNNEEQLAQKEEVIALKPIPLKVDRLSQTVDAIGAFSVTFEQEIPKQLVQQEPFYWQMIVKGEGDFSNIKKFSFSQQGVSVFEDMAKSDLKPSVIGQKGTWVQELAIVGSETFSLPSHTFRYFDTKLRKVVEVSELARTITYTKAQFSPEHLVDAKEFPAHENDGWGVTALSYLFTYLFGFFSAWIGYIKWQRYQAKKPKKEEVSSIDQINDPKQLLNYLIGTNDQRVEPMITKLEAMVYENKRGSLASIKREIQKLKA
jgi:hypothetical protein